MSEKASKQIEQSHEPATYKERLQRLDDAANTIYGDGSQPYDAYFEQRMADVEAGKPTWIAPDEPVDRTVAEFVVDGQPVIQVEKMGVNPSDTLAGLMVRDCVSKEIIEVNVSVIQVVELAEQRVLVSA